MLSFYYDLNDDVLMRDILSGRYTGTPEPKNIQMLFPGSAPVAALYRALPSVDWYGLLLILLQFAVLLTVVVRVARFMRDPRARLRAVPETVLLLSSALLPHLFFLQYTMTVALMSGCAILLILTGRHIGNDIAAALLIGAAFLLRSEMLLLMLPLIALSVCFRTFDERVKNGKIKKRELLLPVLTVVFLAAGAIGNQAACASPEWRTFLKLFDARTELYDFQEIPAYEGNEAFYEGIGLAKEEVTLLENYNYSLDADIDADVMAAAAKEAARLRKASGEAAFGARLSKAFSDYAYRLVNPRFARGYHFPMSDAPYNIILLFLYVAAVIVCFGKEKWWWAKLLLIKGFGAALFLFILFRGRDPVRITHGLYFVESMAVAGVFLPHMKGETGKARGRVYLTLGLVFALLGAFYLFGTLKVTSDEMKRREQVNASYHALYDYFDAHPGEEFYIDVYSSVAASEKVFEHAGGTRMNHDILGGWAAKSPLHDERLAASGVSSAEEGVLKDNAYFVIDRDEDTRWLTDYYALRGRRVELKDVTKIDRFAVYTVREKPR